MDRRRRSPRRGQICPTPLPLARVDRTSPISVDNKRKQSLTSGINRSTSSPPQQPPPNQQHASDSTNIIENSRRSSTSRYDNNSRIIKKQRKPMLIILSENCRKHNVNGATHHECNHVLSDEWDDVPVYCQEALTTLKRILPRVENRIPTTMINNNSSGTSSNYTTSTGNKIGSNSTTSTIISDLGHLCDFYNDVILGGFCPHALHLFDLGKGAVEVLPRILILFQHIISPSLIENTCQILSENDTNPLKSDDAVTLAVWTRICYTIAALMECVPNEDLHATFIADLIYLASDLSVLEESQCLYDSTINVEVEIFNETRQKMMVKTSSTADNKETTSDYFLTITSADSLQSLKSAAFWILFEFLSKQRMRRLSQLDLKYDIDTCKQTPYSDLYFSSIYHDENTIDILQAFLSTIRQSIVKDSIDYKSTNIENGNNPDEKLLHLHMLSLFSAAKVLKLFQTDIAMSEHPILCSLHTDVILLVFQSSSSILSLKEDTSLPISSYVESIIGFMSDMLKSIVQSNGNPNLNQQRNQVRSITLANLFELLVLVNVQSSCTDVREVLVDETIAVQRFKLNILRMIRICASIPCHVGSPSPCNISYFSWTNSYLNYETLVALFNMMKKPVLSQYATWIVSQLFCSSTVTVDPLQELNLLCQFSMRQYSKREQDLLAKRIDNFEIASNGSSVASIDVRTKRKVVQQNTVSKRAKVEVITCSFNNSLAEFLSTALASVDSISSVINLLVNESYKDLDDAIALPIADVQVVVSASAFLLLVGSGTSSSSETSQEYQFLDTYLKRLLSVLKQTCEWFSQFHSTDPIRKKTYYQEFMGVLVCSGVQFYTCMHENTWCNQGDYYQILSDIVNISKQIMLPHLLSNHEGWHEPTLRIVFYDMVMSARCNLIRFGSQSLPNYASLFGEFCFVADDSVETCFWMSPFIQEIGILDELIQENRLSLLSANRNIQLDRFLPESNLVDRTRATLDNLLEDLPSNAWSRLLLIQSLIWLSTTFDEDSRLHLLLNEVRNRRTFGWRAIEFLVYIALKDSESVARLVASRAISQIFSLANSVLFLSRIPSNDSGSIDQVLFFHAILDDALKKDVDMNSTELQRDVQQSTVATMYMSSKHNTMTEQRATVRILAIFCQSTMTRGKIHLSTLKSTFNRILNSLWDTDMGRWGELEGLLLSELECYWNSTTFRPRWKGYHLIKLVPLFFCNARRIGHVTIFRRISWLIQRYLLNEPVIFLDDVSTIHLPLFFDTYLTDILSTLIVRCNYDALRMATAFKLYLMSCKRVAERKGGSGVSATLLSLRDLVNQSYYVERSHELDIQLRLLCLAPNTIERILPHILGVEGHTIINFFTDKVLQKKISLHKMIVSRRQIILRDLILEISRSADPIDIGVKALENAAVARMGSHFNQIASKSGGRKSRSTTTQNQSYEQNVHSAICDWVTLDFLYLLVNAVQFRWGSKTSFERIDSLKCLHFMLDYVYSKDAPLFIPQVMATTNLALGMQLAGATHRDKKLGWKLRLLAITTLRKFMGLVATQSVETLGNNLTNIVVSVIPVVIENHVDDDLVFGGIASKCRSAATALLEWMTLGAIGKSLRPYFADIPFLPSSPYLETFRSLLQEIGIDFDNLTGSLKSHLYDSNASQQSDTSVTKLASLKLRLEKLKPLISDENAGTRIVSLQHLSEILRSNRALLATFVENEETTSIKRSLTIAYKETSVFGGTVTGVVESLLSRCIQESDAQAKTLLAKCVGELGAIGEHRLTQPKPISDATQGDGSFRSMKPPWRSRPVRLELQLLTTHLVKALKTASTANDQNKVAFTVQELLIVLDRNVSKGSSHPRKLKHEEIDETANASLTSSKAKQSMSSWLTGKLTEASVLETVEAFWSTEFQEAENATVKQPPFFPHATSYYGWLSSWCRYMVHRSCEPKENKWNEFFFACRTALRTRAGLPVAEFLLPLLILYLVCFGESNDETIMKQEIIHVLSYVTQTESLKYNMSKTDQQKAVSVIFNTLDLFQSWSQSEIEHRFTTSRTTNFLSPSLRMPLKLSGDEWPLDESIVRINAFLISIPLEIRSCAASGVGMHAHALRLLEMDIRSGQVHRVYGGDDTAIEEVENIRLSKKTQYNLMKDVLSSLNDYETMVAVGEDDFWSTPTCRAHDSIQRNEAIEDWDAALQDYERLQQLNAQVSTSQLGSLRCLLELGHFESVLHQARGLVSKNGRVTDVGENVHSEALPIAVEAAWRLGRWETLSDLVGQATECCQGATKPFQICFGEILLNAQNQNLPLLEASIAEARNIVFDSLSLAARESYSSAYNHIVRLQCLCEVEDVAELVCSKTPAMTSTVNETSLSWDRRLRLASSSGSSLIINSRLALARLANDQSYEGSLFLSIGTSARKKGQLGMAASAFAKAEAAVAALDANGMPSIACQLRLQYAKLKYTSGEVNMALKIIGQENLDSITTRKGEEIDTLSIRRILGSLQHGLDEHQMKDFFVKGALQSTRWMIDGGLKGGGEIMTRFRTIHSAAPKWEKGHFQFAKYLDAVLRSRITAIEKRRAGSGSSDDDSSRFRVIASDKCCQKYILLAMKHYSLALSLDVRHVYQALPRLLTLWFDFTSIKGEKAESPKVPKDDGLAHCQEEANSLMKKNAMTISPQAFYTAIPQLISRISHNDKHTAAVVREILKQVLAMFPGQAMWLLAWIRLSKFRERLSVGNKIFKDAERILESRECKHLLKLLVASKSLFCYLHDLTKYVDKDDTRRTLSVKPWRGEVDLTEFLPPIQAALSVSILSDSKSLTHDLFPRNVPRMRAFCPEVEILVSKARPKKIKIYAISAIGAHRQERTSDSKSHDIGEIHFLLKQEAKGDLRKDARVQDLNNVINRLLSAPSEIKHFRSRRRHLHLRTFAVTCLSEETGILEWVPSTESVRNLVSKSYNPQAPPSSLRRRGKRITNISDPSLVDTFVKKCQPIFFKSGDLSGAASMFNELCLKPYPPLLYWWFVHNFPNPHSWYEARTRFALSAAIWSAVGHIIGLGDRHSENILIDTTSADCVHVDFDCIFDKGLSLPKPEVVPFRLTQNFVDAFGPTGANGIYSENLKVAMSTLRRNRDTLLSVLEPFAKDPIIDWSRTSSQQRGNGNSEHDHQTIPATQDRETKAAKRSMNVIDERLLGIYNLRNPNLRKIKRTDTASFDQEQIVGDEELNQVLPLSVDGQVHKLIAEATSSENLVQLYIGWIPWI